MSELSWNLLFWWNSLTRRKVLSDNLLLWRAISRSKENKPILSQSEFSKTISQAQKTLRSDFGTVWEILKVAFLKQTLFFKPLLKKWALSGPVNMFCKQKPKQRTLHHGSMKQLFPQCWSKQNEWWLWLAKLMRHHHQLKEWHHHDKLQHLVTQPHFNENARVCCMEKETECLFCFTPDKALQPSRLFRRSHTDRSVWSCESRSCPGVARLNCNTLICLQLAAHRVSSHGTHRVVTHSRKTCFSAHGTSCAASPVLCNGKEACSEEQG